MQDEREALKVEEQAEVTPEQAESVSFDTDRNEQPSSVEGEMPVAEAEAPVAEEPTQDEAAPEVPAETEAGEDQSAQIDSDASDKDGGMHTLMLDMDHDYRTFRRGDMVEGVIVSIDKDGMMVDIGTKSEAIVPGHEASRYVAEGKNQVQVGDEVVACVVQPENADGHIVLSLSRARVERGWRQMQKLFEAAESADAEVVDHNKGGLIVSLDGIRGFVPISQIVGLRQNTTNEEEIESRLASMVGKTISVKVLEINRRRNRLILSERAAVRELRAQRKEQLLSELHEGEIRQGRVSSVCDFGAFIDLGGADGLVHLSELSWGQVAHPSDAVKVGDEVNVYVLSVDQEKKKIALSIRRSQPEPWSTVDEKYQAGDIVSATVTKLATFGAFARVEPGVEGLIHVSELAEGHVAHPSKVVKEGDVVNVRIIRVDSARKRLGLSLKQAPQPEVETSEVAEEVAETVEATEAPECAEAVEADAPAEATEEQPPVTESVEPAGESASVAEDNEAEQVPAAAGSPASGESDE